MVFYSISELWAPFPMSYFWLILKFSLQIVCFDQLVGMSAFFYQSTRKSWVCSVFYSTFGLWAIFENVFFLTLFSVFVSPLSWLARGAWVALLVMFFVMPEENIDSVWFFKHFWALGTCLKDGIFRCFLFFSCELYVLVSMWLVFDASMLFWSTQGENVYFVLFLTAFWSCRHVSKRYLF